MDTYYLWRDYGGWLCLFVMLGGLSMGGFLLVKLAGWGGRVADNLSGDARRRERRRRRR